MKRLLIGLALVVGMVSSAGVARAHTPYNDRDSHPLLLASYPVHFVGWSLEWLVTRPIHFLVSQPKLDKMFGSGPSEDPFGDYPAYDPVHPVE